MGACLSSSSTIIDQKQASAAYVISTNGELRQYTVPINVSQVLQSEMPSDASFICNSDRLYFDDFIPCLDSENQLLAGQIYFVLPASKLQYRLSASDMAALAVKASAALEELNKNNRRQSNKFRKSKKSNSRISPMLLQVEDESRDYSQGQSNRTTGPSMGLGVSMRSASVRKLQRLSSRRAKMAVRSFRKLMTIQEGSVLLFN
ncbi:uncharacterized protein LOC132624096 [Lycium barbarum]|uniref:uncharacterized protein LOC132045338 n=1 Tax=Lycium ferocissimum TaxID=112874 RepID=UPI0028167ADB|nr:uncharacterized protein LOC132045338 [Lycium ferocissimum]XP_060194909.1 uncharacterized protein LOC132624096 [Lycium barbarum]